MRYYFHVRRHTELQRDPEGADFATLEDACNEAMHAAREILAERMIRGEIIDGEVFELTTENGDIVRKIPFRTSLRFGE